MEKHSTYRILGLDPGLRDAGYAFIDAKREKMQLVQPTVDTYACGVIHTSEDWPTERRLQHLYTQVRKIIVLYRPDSAAVETFFFARNPRTALHVGQARGVILLALAEEGLPFAEYDPQTVKKDLTGERYAPKKLVGTCVRDQLNLLVIPRPDDAADAAAIAICHYHQRHRGAQGLSVVH